MYMYYVYVYVYVYVHVHVHVYAHVHVHAQSCTCMWSTRSNKHYMYNSHLEEVPTCGELTDGQVLLATPLVRQLAFSDGAS